MIVHQVDEKTYFKSWSFPSSSKTSLCSVNYNYLVIVVSIVIKDIREIRSFFNEFYACTAITISISTQLNVNIEEHICRSFFVRKVQILLLTDYFLMVIQGYHLCFNMSRFFHEDILSRNKEAYLT